MKNYELGIVAYVSAVGSLSEVFGVGGLCGQEVHGGVVGVLQHAAPVAQQDRFAILHTPAATDTLAEALLVGADVAYVCPASVQTRGGYCPLVGGTRTGVHAVDYPLVGYAVAVGVHIEVASVGNKRVVVFQPIVGEVGGVGQPLGEAREGERGVALAVGEPDGEGVAVEFVHIGNIVVVNVRDGSIGGLVVPLEVRMAEVEGAGVRLLVVLCVIHQQDSAARGYGVVFAAARNAVDSVRTKALGYEVRVESAVLLHVLEFGFQQHHAIGIECVVGVVVEYEVTVADVVLALRGLCAGGGEFGKDKVGAPVLHHVGVYAERCGCGVGGVGCDGDTLYIRVQAHGDGIKPHRGCGTDVVVARPHLGGKTDGIGGGVEDEGVGGDNLLRAHIEVVEGDSHFVETNGMLG